MPIPLSEGISYIRVFQGLYWVLQGLTVRIRNSVHVMPQKYSMRELPNAPRRRKPPRDTHPDMQDILCEAGRWSASEEGQKSEPLKTSMHAYDLRDNSSSVRGGWVVGTDDKYKPEYHSVAPKSKRPTSKPCKP